MLEQNDLHPDFSISKPYPRKGTETWDIDVRQCKLPKKFQNHIPARGRKHILKILPKSPAFISKPYPRKGTETRATIFNPSASASISKPYPRKGTETERQLDAPSMSALFQNHIPARGRSVSPASPARAGEGDRVSGGGGAMNASCKPS